MERILLADPPQGAHITFEPESAGNGWHAPLEAPWLNEAVNKASLTFFDKPVAHQGEGGSIPFMSMLLKKFPQAQFMVTGAAGPGNNMHAPNENLHIDYSARLVMCVSQVVATLATIRTGEVVSEESNATAGDESSFSAAFAWSGGSTKWF